MQMEYEHKKYPVEHLIFYCRNEQEAIQYIEANDIWTAALSKYDGFVSTTSYLNKANPGEIHIIIIWETLKDWFAIPKEALADIGKRFDKIFPYPYKNGPRLHIEDNFSTYKISHCEVMER